MKKVLIAGGSGLIGSHLSQKLIESGYLVSILTRFPKNSQDIYWSFEEQEIDERAFDCDVLINLSGASVDKKRWTASRKRELENSRIGSSQFLYSKIDSFINLQQYISASGISAYGFDEGLVEHGEDDSFGTDYLSQLVKRWEHSAMQFESHVPVSCVRIAVVLAQNGGALHKMTKPIKLGLGSPIGSGKQQMPWVHIDDLVNLFLHLIDNKLAGVYNSNASNNSNALVTNAIAKKLNKRLWAPNVPSFVLKLFFGELADIILKGSKASNKKIRETGFVFQYGTIEEALKSLDL